VGKTTLVEGLPGRHVVTLDDLGVLDAATRDPRGFVAALPRPATIDEIQRAPELLLAIKEQVDRHPEPGAFLLTGPARIEAMRGVKDSLAGRVAVHRLWGLTRPELLGEVQVSPLDRLFACADATDAARVYASVPSRPAVAAAEILRGGFPAPALHFPKPGLWHREYRRSYVERDAPAVLRVEDTPAFSRFLLAVAATTAQLLNLTDLARDTGMSVDTARRWLGLLESTCIADRVSPYWRNIRKRLVKTPKVFVADSGLAGTLLGAEAWDATSPSPHAGALFETYVHAQLAPLCEVSEPPTALHFYRDHAQVEVDFVLERAGRLVPLEVKSGATVTGADARGIEALVDLFPSECRFGLVLYGGDQVFPLSARAVAVPLSRFLDGRHPG
jgi:predicted AAA+ superfamily ATPase